MAQVGRQPIFPATAGTGLCLHPPGCCPEGANCSTGMATVRSTMTAATTTAPPEETKETTTRKPLTIVFGDRACTVDVTEAQALEILLTARRGAEQRAFLAPGSDSEDHNGDGPVSAPSCPMAAGPAYQPGTALAQSMKGSLRRFLEKRSARVRDTPGSPYKLQSSPSLCCHGR